MEYPAIRCNELELDIDWGRLNVCWFLYSKLYSTQCRDADVNGGGGGGEEGRLCNVVMLM